eukprot:GFUD01044197.1.p1 GENE.GFUD01044197.1~~GFUD01044197.1.p1  ORF type:complete len:848 (+),score=318.53 GFUD01044197.1:44-2587(+)
MPKKQKIGKQRRDKAYWAAKEIGYRSRASFKLVQLNRKWEFLQKSNVCLDLCAAPGSWMQVAKEHMPLSSLVVGIDLVPIKPIPGTICLQGDITSDKTRADLKKELKTAKADVVLHDGAPNVGKNWINDAYQQSLLTLCSFKLASEFLCKGGWFITKVFRSKDYQALMWVFNQFFNKVHATKPAASRNESAEIFVVCQGYLAPDKIDPKFLDPKSVFSYVEVADEKQHKEIINTEKKKKQRHREGYDDEATDVGFLFKEAKASDFIMGKDTVKILNECNSIVIDVPRIDKHKRTTDEVRECIKDLKVLGMKELRMVKKWKDALKKEFDELDEANNGVEEAVPAILVKTKDEIEDEEMAEVDKQIDELKDEERRAARRKRKKELKEKQRRIEKINLKMIIPGDEGPTATEEGLFRMSDLKNKADLDMVVNDGKVDALAEESEEEEEVIRSKHEKYDKETGVLDSEGLWYNDQIDQGKESDDSDDSDEGEELGLEWEEENENDGEENEIIKQDEASANPLITSLSNDDLGDRRAKKAEMWFQKIGDLEDDSDLEEAEMQRAVDIVEKKGGSIKKKFKEVEKSNATGYHSDSDDDDKVGNIHHETMETDSDDDTDDEEEVEHKSASGKVYNKDGFEIVPKQKIKKRKALSCEELALGEQLIKSKKAKRDIMDNGWNRFMFNDEHLPDWFVKEEDMHMKKKPDVDPEVVEKYREMGKEMNVKTIKRVVEAKARRKRRVAKKLDQARKKSAHILENEDIGSREKASEIDKLYKKAAQAGKEKKEVSYVVAKKHRAQRLSQRPSGIKGPYKQVDKRMKKDSETKRGNAKQGKKRRLKGKQAKPTKQYNTNKKK